MLSFLFLGCSLAFSLLGLGLTTPAHAQSGPAIAAAADLQFVLGEIATKFEAAAGQDVRLTFGSSRNFAQRLQQGTPFEMFLSADEGFVFRLAHAGRTTDRGELYAEGRIVLFVPKGSVLKADAKLDDLRAALKEGRITRFAISNPEHAPYGRAAEQTLKSLGLLEAIRPKLVLGENVSQAAQFASSGASQGGIFGYCQASFPASILNQN